MVSQEGRGTAMTVRRELTDGFLHSALLTFAGRTLDRMICGDGESFERLQTSIASIWSIHAQNSSRVISNESDTQHTSNPSGYLFDCLIQSTLTERLIVNHRR